MSGASAPNSESPFPGHIPGPAVKRLSLYLRELEAHQRAGDRTVSSRRLGAALGLTDAQVRKDLAYFGQFGQPGIGYDVPALSERIRRILGTDRPINVVLVGAGNLGSALAAYRGFVKRGFNLVAVFDSDTRKAGQVVPGTAGVTVRPVSDIATVVQQHDVRLAILAVPAESAQEAANRLIAAGVRGLLNFAPVVLNVPETVATSAVDMAVHLEQLCFQLGVKQRGQTGGR
ncbi:MAG: redox-sensing transcriptional repressor Rex [Phycisphaerae bacterium]